MTFPTRRVEGRFWRMHLPRWAHEPLSGEGAKRFGGRWNPEGTPALYLSTTHATAISEAHQLLVQPGVLVPYDVTAPRVADLADPSVAAHIGVSVDVMRCEWRRLWRLDGKQPPTWAVAERLIAEGCDGALVPSVVGPDNNLVLWRWNEGNVTVSVRDPDDVLSRTMP
jgi:RES domain-containing protein